MQTLRAHGIETIIHFAAESHVDRSILSGAEFVRTNVMGTQTLLDVAMKAEVKKFVMVSTDEVYGSLGEEGFFTEETPLAPNSPYSASKAGADLLCRAYHHTFGFPVVTTRCSNNYGPLQFPEKLIPLMIIKAMAGRGAAGLRRRAQRARLDSRRGSLRGGAGGGGKKGPPARSITSGRVTSGPTSRSSSRSSKSWARVEDQIRYVKDRPGHDRRYAIDSSKAQRELGWAPTYEFGEGLRQTVQWYLDREPWWRAVMSGEYMKYYEKNYADKMV